MGLAHAGHDLNHELRVALRLLTQEIELLLLVADTTSASTATRRDEQEARLGLNDLAVEGPELRREHARGDERACLETLEASLQREDVVGLENELLVCWTIHARRGP